MEGKLVIEKKVLNYRFKNSLTEEEYGELSTYCFIASILKTAKEKAESLGIQWEEAEEDHYPNELYNFKKYSIKYRTPFSIYQKLAYENEHYSLQISQDFINQEIYTFQVIKSNERLIDIRMFDSRNRAWEFAVEWMKKQLLRSMLG